MLKLSVVGFGFEIADSENSTFVLRLTVQGDETAPFSWTQAGLKVLAHQQQHEIDRYRQFSGSAAQVPTVPTTVMTLTSPSLCAKSSIGLLPKRSQGCLHYPKRPITASRSELWTHLKEYHKQAHSGAT
ncbi:hypothetical protein AJ80_06585 [Polytolypa hystricis UAMH7299]|uniref:Uncharacterized protein n=1 Tax=Polytolypa hystricis (strain UAMH7299) TaxID=1447883 RepID=A0A2B7XVH7_POLH7|nr:hypothetical protein AJ80_06585 [Polytolypa hystricis UAMH7299]